LDVKIKRVLDVRKGKENKLSEDKFDFVDSIKSEYGIYI